MFIGATAFANEGDCRFRDRPCAFPNLTLSFEAGANAFVDGNPFGFGRGAGAGTSPGPTWGFRVGWEFMKWFAVDAHYIGAINLINRDYAPNGSARLVTNAALAEARFTFPLHYVQPYLFAGVGVYGTSVAGRRDGTAFHDRADFGLPMGAGAGVPITNHLTIGAEVAHHSFIGSNFSADDVLGSNGDLTTFNAVLRIRL